MWLRTDQLPSLFLSVIFLSMILQFTDALVPSPNIKFVENQLRNLDYAIWLRSTKYPTDIEDQGGTDLGTAAGSGGQGHNYNNSRAASRN